MKDSVYRASALRGRALLLATRDSLPRNVGNSLRCASCHLDGGLRRDAMPWVGSYARFPQYRARSGKVDLIEDRINDCFRRSMNGRALNPAGGDMRDIVTYFAFLSSGIPVGAEMEGQGLPRLQPLKGDPARGARRFRDHVRTVSRSEWPGHRTRPTTMGAPLVQPRSRHGENQHRRIVHSRAHADRSRATSQRAAGVRRRDLHQHTSPPRFSRRRCATGRAAESLMTPIITFYQLRILTENRDEPILTLQTHGVSRPIVTFWVTE